MKAAQAFDQARESSTKTIITTKIETPSSIKYNDTGSYHEWKQTLPQGESAWILQREEAFKEIKIQYHFFKNFKKTLADLNIKL